MSMLATALGELDLFDGRTLLLLAGGGFVLCVLAIVVDRFNFPQRRFRPKRIALNTQGAKRDRTGAHVVDESHRGLHDPSSPSNRSEPSR